MSYGYVEWNKSNTYIMFASVLHKTTPISYGPILFAGSGTAGSNNGTGTDASFNNPTWIVADQNGVYYISDTGNHTIRKMTNAGVVTTIFGTPGVSGSDTSHLNSPRGISVDSASNLYVADYSNNRVFYIPSGSSTGSNVGTVSNVVQVAADSTGCNVIAMTNDSGKNMYQIRNGVVEGLLNTSVSINGTIYDLNASSIAYSPSGSFYWGTTAEQFNNQVGMYRLGTLQTPSNLTTPVNSIFSYNGSTGQAIVSVSSSTGITPGMPFTLSGFSSGSVYNGYTGKVLAVNQSASNNFTFQYIQTPAPSAGSGTFTSAIINNSSNGLTINGSAVGYLVANIQFPPVNINAFYASAQYGQGIQKYNLIGDAGTSAESNSYAGNPSSFCVMNFPTPELVTLVPTGSSNNISIYSKLY